MAVSKNNRKKSKKRAQQHMSPVRQNERMEQKEQSAKSSGEIQWINLLSLIFMVMGFLVAMFSEYGIVGYPVTFIGSLMGLTQTKWDTRRNKISFVTYILYCVFVAYLWVQLLIGQA